MLVIFKILDSQTCRCTSLPMQMETIIDSFNKNNIKYKEIYLKNPENIITTINTLDLDDIIMIQSAFFGTKEANIIDKIINILNNRKIILINTESVFSYTWLLDKSILQHDNLLMICDYEYKNMKYYTKQNVIFYPPSYSEVYESSLYKITNSNDKTIDILFYGCMNKRRTNVFKKIIEKKINLEYVSGYDNLQKQINDIAHSKIVLIIHFYEDDRPIDPYRISHLISNKVFIIHETPQDEEKNHPMYDMMTPIFADYNDIPNKCQEYLKKIQEERDIITEQFYEIYKRDYNMQNNIPSKFKHYAE